VVGVVDLEARETRRGHVDDDVVGDGAAACRGGGMREHRHPAGLVDQPDGIEDVELELGPPVPTVGADPARRECLRDGPQDPALHQRLGDVRPSDRASREFADLLPADGDPVGDQHPDHLLRPVDAALDERVQLHGQRLVRRVEEVAQQVQADAVAGARDLGSANQPEPGGQGGSSRGPTGRRVVVGQRDHVETGVDRRAHQQVGGCRAVGGRRVRVEVDHEAGHRPRLAAGVYGKRGEAAPTGRSIAV
jgi:hypothetical protein